jgi:hypothetical protein
MSHPFLPTAKKAVAVPRRDGGRSPPQPGYAQSSGTFPSTTKSVARNRNPCDRATVSALPRRQIIPHLERTVMKFRHIATLSIGVLLLGATMAQAQEKQYTAPSPPSEAPATRVSPEAAAAFTGSSFGWVSIKGTWDGRGLFHENLGATFYVAKAHQYFEDSNYCYYQENTATNWLWALGKNPVGGQVTIWVSTTIPIQWTRWPDGVKLPRTGDAYP